MRPCPRKVYLQATVCGLLQRPISALIEVRISGIRQEAKKFPREQQVARAECPEFSACEYDYDTDSGQIIAPLERDIKQCSFSS